MAQDFGDEIGDILLREMKLAAKQALSKVYHHRKHALAEKQAQFYKQHGISLGMNAAQANQYAARQANKELAIISFGSATDSAYFAKLCQENGTNLISFTDNQGNGFIQFAKDDLPKLLENIPQFSKLMTVLYEQQFIKRMKPIEPTPELFNNLHLIQKLPELPSLDTAVHDIPINRTAHIAEKVSLAKEAAKNFEEFKELLAQDNLGLTTSVKGEHLFYEARLGKDGELLPYSHEKRDWSVSADTLKNKYNIDATIDTLEQHFTENRDSNSDGSLDIKGETADINQGIESHDGMDTNATTLRLEREGVNTDTPPSVTKSSVPMKTTDKVIPYYSLESQAKAARQAAKELAKERQVKERITDISDKLNPVR